MLRKSSVQSHWESTVRVFYIEMIKKTQKNKNHHITAIAIATNNNGPGFHDLHDLYMFKKKIIVETSFVVDFLCFYLPFWLASRYLRISGAEKVLLQ